MTHRLCTALAQNHFMQHEFETECHLIFIDFQDGRNELTPPEVESVVTKFIRTRADICSELKWRFLSCLFSVRGGLHFPAF